MSTHNPHPQIVENAPELIATLFEPEMEPVDEPGVEPDGDGEDIDYEPNAKPRPVSEPEHPPRGASRNLGGACPKCGGPMSTRLRAEYGSTTDARLRLDGFCEGDDDCRGWYRGYITAVDLEPRGDCHDD